MPCETCNEQITGTCKEFINADCIYVAQELTVTGVQANTVLSTALARMDEVIGQVKEKVAGTLALINIGTGAKVYKGLSGIGEREIRTLTSIDSSVTITEGVDTIDFAVDVSAPTVPSADETTEGISRRATQIEVNAGVDDTTHVTPLKLATYVSTEKEAYTLQIAAGNVELLKDGVVVSTEVLPTGTDTYATAFNLTGTTLEITMSDANVLSQDISSLLNFTQVQADLTQENSSETSYIKNRNPSKTVFANYTVVNEDNNYVIVIDSAGAVTITLPATLPDKFTVGFLQKGIGLVTIANADIVPEGFASTIRGKGHHAYVEKIQGTKFLLGNLNKAV